MIARGAAALLLGAASLGFLSGCAARHSAIPRAPARVASLLEGSYSSAEQAMSDPDYRDIRLVMVPIWKDRADGPWLYVEQAMAGKESEPYRQRVYHLVADKDGAVRSVIYTLPDPKAAVLAWKAAAPLADLEPETLVLRQGCDVVLSEKPDGSFEGGTVGNSCASDLRGAAYATSTSKLTPAEMVSWDRGYDASGKQVWGAEKGGYVFRKLP